MAGIDAVRADEGARRTMVCITAAQVACSEGLKDTWRGVAVWTAGQLKAAFGDEVQVEYYDLLDPDCPPLPPDAQLPFVTVNGEVLSSGGKISVPALRRRLQELGLPPRA